MHLDGTWLIDAPQALPWLGLRELGSEARRSVTVRTGHSSSSDSLFVKFLVGARTMTALNTSDVYPTHYREIKWSHPNRDSAAEHPDYYYMKAYCMKALGTQHTPHRGEGRSSASYGPDMKCNTLPLGQHVMKGFCGRQCKCRRASKTTGWQRNRAPSAQCVTGQCYQFDVGCISS